LSDDERWQLTMLLSRADRLPAAAQAELTRKEAGEIMPPGHEHEHEHGTTTGHEHAH
jgi:ABC-type nickel/cobalt efflux system permease component RcnA